MYVSNKTTGNMEVISYQIVKVKCKEVIDLQILKIDVSIQEDHRKYRGHQLPGSQGRM
jgi:hypothetical protein